LFKRITLTNTSVFSLNPVNRIIVVLPHNCNSLFICNILENGASGYVLKNATSKELLEAINVVMSGNSYLSSEAAFALRKTNIQQPLVTRREKEILLLIAEDFTNAEMAVKLFISIPTVNTHCKSLLEKFEVKNTATPISGQDIIKKATIVLMCINV
jgi:DNA-binding NarL/FixJ family response regulator